MVGLLVSVVVGFLLRGWEVRVSNGYDILVVMVSWKIVLTGNFGWCLLAMAWKEEGKQGEEKSIVAATWRKAKDRGSRRNKQAVSAYLERLVEPDLCLDTGAKRSKSMPSS